MNHDRLTLNPDDALADAAAHWCMPTTARQPSARHSSAGCLQVINRYLDNPLRLADESTGKIRVSGVYSIDEVERLVDNLPKVLPVYLTRSQDGSTVLNRISPPPSRG